MKKFLICLSILFSFLFIGNVKATTVQGTNLEELLDNHWETYFEGKKANQISSSSSDKVLYKEDFPYTTCYYISMNNGEKWMDCQYWHTLGSKTVNSNSNSISYNSSNPYGVYPGFTYNLTKKSYVETLHPRNTSYYSRISVYFNSYSIYSFSYSNFDVTDNNNNLMLAKNMNYDASGKKNVSFHLNGGTIIDVSDPLNPQTYQENFTLELKQSDLNTFINSQTPINGSSEFLGWYYDANFTQPYNSSDTISSDIDLYAKWETPKTFNFYLNGGYLYDPSDGWGSEEDFSISLYNSEIEQFFTNLEVKKASMLFDGWFYDNNYKNIFHINDNFTEDTYNLYAKWRYEKVDDFLSNTTFNEYTFDTMYDYAIITKGDKLGDIYLGLNLDKYEITVYEYNENLSNYEEEKGFCLVPIYSKNGTYYYNLDTSSTSYTEVLVLPKTVFENNNYSFLLTDNAYITYTNNLEDTVIYDSNGNQINTNLEDTYQTFQDSMISDEHDLLTIFKNLTKFKDNNVFNNINTIWNKFKRTDLYTYFMILIVGGLIILIIKGAKRS